MVLALTTRSWSRIVAVAVPRAEPDPCAAGVGEGDRELGRFDAWRVDRPGRRCDVDAKVLDRRIVREGHAGGRGGVEG